MKWKWTRPMHQLVAAVIAGTACWALTVLTGLGQTTSSSSDATQTNRNQGSYSTPSSSGQYGAAQSGSNQSRYGQSSADQYRSGTANRQGRDAWQDSHGQSRDSIGEARDDMRDTSRQSRDQSQNNRDDDRNSTRFDRDDFDDQNRRDFSQRDSSRDNQRDDSGSQNQRDFNRANDRDDFRNHNPQGQSQQGQRDFSRDGQGDASSDRRDQFQDNRSSQGRSDQFQSNRSDQFQSNRFDQRSGQPGFQNSSRGAAGAQASASSGQNRISRAADLGLWLNRNTNNGLVISDIASSGPITRFGFQEGDQILSVNGNRVASEQQFLNLLTSPQFVNQRAQVQVWRNGQQVPIWVEPWTLVHQGGSAYAQSDPLEPFGIVLDDRYQSPVVWKVQPQSPAYYAGIRGNDIIVAWNGQHVNDPQELHNAAEQTQQSEIPVQLSRNRQLRNVTLEADSQSRTALRPTYEQSYDGYGAASQQGYSQPQAFQQGYTQGQTYIQPGTTYGQPGTTYIQPQSGTSTQPTGTYQQNRPGLIPWLRGR